LSQEPIPSTIYRYAQRLVRQYDRDGDGVLDAEEWKPMHGDPRLVDANKDGLITVEEMAQWIADYGRNRRIRLAVPAIGLSGDSETNPGSPATSAGASGSKPGPSAEPTTAEDEDAGIDLAELEASRRRAKFYRSPKRLPAGLPSWFLARDEDGDGQLTLSEFAPKPTPADLREFQRYDLNGDGLITAQECLKAMKSMKSSAKKAKGR
jgi:Ca2+-binding EF-hand superfamily protein